MVNLRCRIFFGLVLMLLTNISLAQFIEATVVVGKGPADVVCDTIANKLFVACKDARTVAVIDAVTNTVVGQIPIDLPPQLICWNSTNNKIYAVGADSLGNGKVAVIDATNNSLITTVNVGTQPVSIVWTATSNKVYCANQGDSLLTVIDGESNNVTGVIPLGQKLNHMVWNATSNKLYVASGLYGDTGKIRVINCEDDRVVAVIKSATNNYRLTWNPIDNRVYCCANCLSNTITVIDGVTDSVLARFSSGGFEPSCILWTDPNRVYVGNYWASNVVVISGDTLCILGNFSVPSMPTKMFFNPITSKLFIAQNLANLILIVNGRRNYEGMPIETLRVGNYPNAFAFCPSRVGIYVANYIDSTVTVIKDMVEIKEENLDRSSYPTPVSLVVCPSIVGKNQTVTFKANGFSPTELSVYRIDGTRVYQARNRSVWSWTPQVPTGIYISQLTGQKVRATAKFLVR